MINSFIEIFKRPITATNEQADNTDLKGSFIKSAIVSAVFFVCSFITCFFSEAQTYEKGKKVFSFKYFEFENVIKPAITTLIVMFVVILVVAAIMYIISRILKNENSYAKLLAISANAFVPMAVASIITLLTSWLWEPIGMVANIIAALYLMYILIFAFRNTLNIENEDMLTLLNILVITVAVIIMYFVITSVFSDLLYDLDILDMFM